MSTGLSSLQILKTLIGFDTTSYKSNLDLIRYVEAQLNSVGITSQLVFDASQNKANLFATVGPSDTPGVILSGHTDVVPVTGQDWATNPFSAVQVDGRLYGRGSADMKGFVACAIHAMLKASTLALTTPLHLCLSYDEEVGCIGVRHILDVLQQQLVTPKLCIIGEPTMMQIATGHKGKAVYQAICRGEEGHSAFAPKYQNAIHIAASFIESMQKTQAQLMQTGARDAAYAIPYSTIHIGKINGGTALNIVPNQCVVDFEIRHLANEQPKALVEAVCLQMQQQDETGLTWINIDKKTHYPGLETPSTLDAVRLLQTCLPKDSSVSSHALSSQLATAKMPASKRATTKIAFGTEGGLFNQALACPVLVCGPGSITVAHKPNEYIAIEQLNQCEAFLQRLLAKLS